MKRISCFLLVMVLLVCGVSAVALKAEQITGLWVSVTMVEDGVSYDAQGILSIQLNEDGTLLFPDEGEDVVYTWKIKKEEVHLFNPDGSESDVVITYQDDTLYLNDGLYCFAMEKQE